MDELRTLIQQADRAASRVPLPPDGIERLTRVRVRRHRNQRVIAVGVGLAIGLAAVITGTSILRGQPVTEQTPPVSAPPSAVAFNRTVSEGGSSVTEQVFVERPDGTTTQLTHGPDSNTLDSWSPDGSQILVARTFVDGSGSDLFAMRVDGSSETRLTTDAPAEADGQWSPDGSRITFRSGTGVSVMNADGTGVRRLTARTNQLPNTFSWSPDGSRIAFIRVGPRGSEIDIVDADGTHETVLKRPNPPTAYTQLAWSPDGSTIAYVVGTGHSTQIDLMDVVGKSVVRLSSIQAARPTWSPDGSRISVEGAGGVYVVEVGDGVVHHVSGSGSGTVSWSPDGSVIAIFDGGDIMIMNPDGSDRIRVAGTDARETGPLWQPGG